MLDVILVGFMGTGKTTVGEVLAANFKRPQIDLDDEIITTAGKSIKQIFADSGEVAFRQLETQVLKQAFTKNGILSTGGGVVESAANRELLRQTAIPVIYLQTEPAAIFQRLKSDDGRPLVQQLGEVGLRKLWQRRVPLYQQVATHTITTDTRTPQQVSQQIQQLLGQEVLSHEI
ncbi:shikimate kinase [Loigolactobacillus zhaoyuanensis]|uniref:Shikimate kinase n=1 Tax=Loigolactobacillus zhaoyuanensis TaxID=2486017 RepID=A0ABW8UB54_9LACO|nr:shikimate kinase [Loigolactobacillus zhaoyuanensis]